MLQTIRRKFIGDKAFYKMVLIVAVPIMVQNGITNFVNMLDNIMVGRVGLEQMSGVSIVNQLLFVFNITIFGGLAGAGIFTAQFFGSRDHDGVRQTFRFKLFLGILLTVLATLIFIFLDDTLISYYLKDDGSGNIAETLRYGKEYLRIMLLGLPAFMMVQVYASTQRECGETILPMKAGLIAVFINLIFNYLLIYGKLGFPEMGVRGAAVATVISRYTEMLIVMLETHLKKNKYPYMTGLYRSAYIPSALLKNILIKGTPLLINELFWALGQAVMSQCFAFRGLSVVAALNISGTLSNLFSVVFIALGGSVGIIIGQQLGANNMKKARDLDNKLIFFTTVSCIGIALLLALAAPYFPRFYNTTDEIKELATQFLWIAAGFMPLHACIHSAYFTLRSGGKTVITFLFDNGFTWCGAVPVAFLLSRYTDLPIIPIYFIVFSTDFIKTAVGLILVKKGTWLKNIVEK